MSTNYPRDILRNKPKTALITGAGQGIGAQIARCFVDKGYFVAFVDYNQEIGSAQEKSLGDRAKFYFCDLSDFSQVKALSSSLEAQFDTIDVIIHNAKSPAKEKDIVSNLSNEWDQTFKVMLKHPILLNQLLIETLKKSPNPSIVFIGSTNSQFISRQPLSYHVLKGALLQTVRYLACEYGSYKIRVNLLNPGLVDVPGRAKRNPEIFQKTIEHVIPLQRSASAKEIGECCLFFASEEAKYLTGTALDLDGGEHLKDHFDLMMSHFMNISCGTIK